MPQGARVLTVADLKRLPPVPQDWTPSEEFIKALTRPLTPTFNWPAGWGDASSDAAHPTRRKKRQKLTDAVWFAIKQKYPRPLSAARMTALLRAQGVEVDRSTVQRRMQKDGRPPV